MNFLTELFTQLLCQLQSPSLAFLIAVILLAALGSRLVIHDAIYKFVVFMLLMKVGLVGGVEIRDANLVDMALPALFAIMMGLGIVLLGNLFFSFLPTKRDDGLDTGKPLYCSTTKIDQFIDLIKRLEIQNENNKN